MFLKRLQIEDVRSIANMELHLDDEAGGTRKWTLLLGENGTGKSTILRCMALLLCGRDALPELLGQDPSDWIRAGRPIARVTGAVTTAEGSEQEIGLELHRGEGISKTLERNATSLDPLEKQLESAGNNYFVAGYGASRRLGQAGFGSYEEGTGRIGRVRTLFDADAALLPLTSWAMDLDYSKGESALGVIRSTLAKLLPEVTFLNIDRRRKALMFATPDGDVSLADLSDGYQNVAAWVGDLLYRTTATVDGHANPLAAPGLLLIDELDLHLHVKWQRRLRRFLEDKLPRFQIVATTHSPMTAQQAGPGEVHVLARPTAGTPPEVWRYEGDPCRLGLHQVIDPLFDVKTVDSEPIAALKGEYRALAAKKPRSKGEARRLAELREELADVPEWNGGAAGDEQTKALRSIKELLEKAGADLSKPPGGKTRQAKS